MATSSETRHFPTIDDVLNELKSNGTFDKFRKSCLASVQAEPSFRAYGEHIEVVSRRYLQNFKWRESTTKNQARTRLKDHALRVIESPDIQVGVPFSELVEKAMETQGKELLPKIIEVVNALQKARPSHAQVSQHAAADERKISGGDGHKTGLEFDMSLPIDLPGLMPTVKTDALSSKKEPTVAAESAAKSSRNKPKIIDISSKIGGTSKPAEGSSKGGCVSKLKGNGKSNSEAKDTKNEKDISQKSPLLSDEKKYFKPKPLRPLKANQEDDKICVHTKQIETSPQAETVTGQNVNKEPTKATKDDLCTNEPRTRESVGNTSKLRDEGKTVIEERLPEAAESNVGENDIVIGVKEDKKRAKESFDDNESKDFKVEADPLFDDKSYKNEDRKKGILPPRRRSARIASLSDDQKLETDSNQGDDTAERKGAKRRTPDKSLHEAKKTKVQSYRSRKEVTSRKRGRAYLNSSSDESDVEGFFSSEKIAIEEVPDRYASKRSGYRKRQHNFDQEDIKGDFSRKRHKTVSRTASPASTGSSASSSVMLQEGPSSGRHYRSEDQQSSSSRKGSSRSPTPAVITRYNRHVKPNRRYYGSDEDKPMEEGGESWTEEQPVKTRKFSRWAK